jgi:hypothetical protein
MENQPARQPPAQRQPSSSLQVHVALPYAQPSRGTPAEKHDDSAGSDGGQPEHRHVP